jgi:uncharacterized protein YjaG (DUF416 family)
MAMIKMYNFDETQLLQQLAIQPALARSVFALGAATRLLNCYELFAIESGVTNAQRLRQITNEVWGNIYSADIRKEFLIGAIDGVMELLPDTDESDALWLHRALAEDAVSALAYAIRSLAAPDEQQEAAWAARRAYEAVDQAAIWSLGVQPGVVENEKTILNHAWVQRELSRQQRDISLLINHSYDVAMRKIHELALSEVSLSIDEIPFPDPK